jgi:biopolymer transport protein ExbD
MIDCTFLLVIFFVLTSAFTTLNLEDVLLPVAVATSEQHPEGSTLIVNIIKKNDADRTGKIIFNGSPQTYDSLVRDLRLEVQFDKDKRGAEAGPGGIELSKLEILVRADEGVKGEYLREVFRACQEVGIWKVKLSALQSE